MGGGEYQDLPRPLASFSPGGGRFEGWSSSPLSASRAWAQPKATGWLRPAWPKRSAENDRDVQRGEALGDGLFAAAWGLLRRGQVADDEAAARRRGRR